MWQVCTLHFILSIPSFFLSSLFPSTPVFRVVAVQCRMSTPHTVLFCAFEVLMPTLIGTRNKPPGTDGSPPVDFYLVACNSSEFYFRTHVRPSLVKYHSTATPGRANICMGGWRGSGVCLCPFSLHPTHGVKCLLATPSVGHSSICASGSCHSSGNKHKPLGEVLLTPVGIIVAVVEEM